jgi:hypothetical protein
MLEGRQLTGYHGLAGALGAEEVAHQRGDLIAIPVLASRVDPVQERAERRRELSCLTV